MHTLADRRRCCCHATHYGLRIFTSPGRVPVGRWGVSRSTGDSIYRVVIRTGTGE
nr:hypothetical protein [Kibdelosporangium sp. MJ126-NF4]CTQ96389.1 hypothetical protein [Kibdelosporangium sp. MJ126-NF4]